MSVEFFARHNRRRTPVGLAITFLLAILQILVGVVPAHAAIGTVTFYPNSTGAAVSFTSGTAPTAATNYLLPADTYYLNSTSGLLLLPPIGTKITAPASSYFTGWKDRATGTIYNPDDAYTVGSSNVAFEATWTTSTITQPASNFISVQASTNYTYGASIPTTIGGSTCNSNSYASAFVITSAGITGCTIGAAGELVHYKSYIYWPDPKITTIQLQICEVSNTPAYISINGDQPGGGPVINDWSTHTSPYTTAQMAGSAGKLSAWNSANGYSGQAVLNPSMQSIPTSTTSYKFGYAIDVWAYLKTSSSGVAVYFDNNTCNNSSLNNIPYTTPNAFTTIAPSSYGSFVGGTAAAVAGGTNPPTLTESSSASSVSTTGATLSGTINPNGAALTSGVFRYGTSSTLSSGTTDQVITPTATGLSTSTTTNVSATLTGLTPFTTYYYELIATNAAGTSTFPTIYSFTTSGIAPTIASASISGTTTVGQTLTASATSATGTPTPTASYQWYSSSSANGTYSAITGATNSTYIPVGSDRGMYLKVAITETNGVSPTATATSSATAQIAGANQTVTFVGNGSDGGSTSAQTSNVAAALTTNGFTKSGGYTFSNWSTNADGTGNIFSDGASFDFLSSITLYAQWRSSGPATYLVAFDPNGGSGTMANQSSTSAANLTANTFTRTSYSFSGWNTKSDGSGTSYANLASYPFTSSVTLYAQWTHNSYTVTFNGNGSDGGSTSSQTSSAQANLTANGFTRTGYTFAGWATSASGTVAYPDQASYNFGASITLYATWTHGTYTVTFSPNGGSGSMVPQTASASTALTANSYIYINKNFAGWCTVAVAVDAACSGTTYSDQSIYSFTAGITLYARWVTAGSPSISPTTQNISGTAGTAITASSAFSATFFSGAPTYSISPTLPSGLTLNSATGVISGTPVAGQALTTFTITATYSSASQTATSSVNVVVSALVPGAPTAVSGVAGTGQVTVSWTAPTSNGGASITDYTLQYSADGGSTWATFSHSASSATTMVVTGLSGSSYIFKVAAVNSVGTGSYSTNSAAVVLSSNVSTLSSLTSSAGTWTPSFSTGTGNYAIAVDNSVGSITVTPTVTQANATVKVNTVSVTSGQASGAQTLNVGTNTITVIVTAQDGSTQSTYTLTVTRAASSVSTLSNLTTSTGTLSPTFSSSTNAYTFSVSNATGSITVTPTVTDPTASVKVNGVAVASGQASGPVNLNVGANNITVLVTAQDGSTTTYTVTVTRDHSDQSALAITSLAATFGQTLNLATSGGSGSGAVSYTVVSGSCTILNGVLTPTGAGTCVVFATKAGDATYKSATSPQVTINIDKANQSLTFATTSYALVYGATQTVVASGQLGTGSVTYFDNSSTACAVDPHTGVVTITAASGNCLISASVAADANYYGSTSSNSVTITVAKADQASLGAITLNAPDKVYPYSYAVAPVVAAGGSGMGALSITAVADGTAYGCSFVNGVLTAATSGTCVLTVTKAADANYNAATTTATFTFNRALQPSLAITSTSGFANQALALTNSGGAGTGAVSFTTSTQNCVINTVNGTYELSLVSSVPTTCEVTVFQAADVNYQAAQATAQVGLGTQVSSLTINLEYNATGASQNVRTRIVATANTNGNVAFSAGGVLISGCEAVATGTNYMAYCDWTPTSSANGLVISADFTPTLSTYAASSASDTINVTSGSLSGLNPNDLVNLFKTTTDGTTSATFTATSSATNTGVSLSIPAGAFNTLTELNMYLYTGASSAIASNITLSSYLLDVVVEWHAMDGSRPVANSPLQLTVTDSRIKVGMGLYAIVGGAAVLQPGLAQDGTATFSLTSDPGAVIAFIAPASPIAVTAVAGNGQATVSWSAPSNNGGSPIASYTVTASNGSSCTVTSGNPVDTTCVVTGLTNGSPVNFTVTATNAAGLTSPASAASSDVTPAGVPDAPTNVSTVAGDGSVTLHWTAPSFDGGSAITNYAVRYSTDAGQTWTTVSHSASVSTSLAINGLNNGVSYLFEVAAVNSIGTGVYAVAGATVTPLSATSTLSSLMLSSGTLSPNFAAGTIAYSVTVSNGTSSITITPTATQGAATITVNGTAVTSGSASGAIALSPGNNIITITVTAQNGVTIATYTVTVTRQLPDVSSLGALSISTGTLTPGFSMGTFNYTVSVENGVTSITVTATVTDQLAALTINTISVTSGSASGPISLSVGSNTITVTVIAQNGTSTSNYVINVTRAAAVSTTPPSQTPTPTPTPTPVTLAPIVPIPVPIPPAGGTALVSQGGTPVATTVAPNQATTAVEVKAPDWTLTISGHDVAGNTLPLDNQARIVIEDGQFVQIHGTVYLPNTDVYVYIFSSPILLGVLKTDANGVVLGSLPIPAGLELGIHTIQVDGYSPQGIERSASVPAIFRAPVGKVLKTRVLFAGDSAAITATAAKVLKSLVSKISSGYANLQVGAEGYVQLSDTKVASTTLSAQRAKNVLNFLKKFGLKGQFVSLGKGVALEKGAIARRVNVTITYQVKQ